MTRSCRVALTCGVAFVPLLLASCQDGTIVEPTPSPGIVFYNGDVITLEPVSRVDEAILVRGSEIVATGTNDLIRRMASRNDVEVDLVGRTVMPGFVDAHSHWLQDALGNGLDISTLHDRAVSGGTTSMGEPFIQAWALPLIEAWAADGNLKIRTNLYLLARINVCGDPVDDWWKDVTPTAGRAQRLWIAGTKMFSDGGACNQPAVSVEFEPGVGFGDLYATADDVSNFVRESEELGFQAIVHALGDRAVDVALDGMEMALGGAGNPHRHRIEHSYIIRDDQLPRYSEIGVVPVVFGYLLPGHLETRFLGTSFGCPAATRNEFYQASEGQLRKLLDANPNLPVAWQNDYPGWIPANPLWELHNMVTRRRVFADLTVCEPPTWMANTAITVGEALEMMTVNAAYALGRENHVGSLRPGKFADLIVLSGNPLTVDPTTIWQIQVQMTMIGGTVESCAEGQAAVCPLNDQP